MSKDPLCEEFSQSPSSLPWLLVEIWFFGWFLGNSVYLISSIHRYFSHTHLGWGVDVPKWWHQGCHQHHQKVFSILRELSWRQSCSYTNHFSVGAAASIWAHCSKTQPWGAHFGLDYCTWWSFPAWRILWPSGSFHISSGSELLQSSHKKNFSQGTLCRLCTSECPTTFSAGILVFFEICLMFHSKWSHSLEVVVKAQLKVL